MNLSAPFAPEPRSRGLASARHQPPPVDDLPSSSPPRYCPTGLLAGFALLMAGQGRCVNTAMMLGDHDYALWQLACARACGNAELAVVAERLRGYFDDPRAAG